MMNNNCRQLQYDRNGDPSEVLHLVLRPVPVVDSSVLDPNAVLVRWLASPVNPVDLYIIQGTYPLKPKMPAIAGREAVGVVEKVGTSPRGLKVGDRVIRQPIFSGPDMCKGVWTDYGIMHEDSLLRIGPNLDIIMAATLGINPPTAYVMLKHIAQLEKGDWLVQNGSNSGVGRAVIQLARHFGYKTVNLVRMRTNIEELKQELFSLGADQVLTEDEFRNQLNDGMPKAKVALDCVGGKSSMLISSALEKGQKCISYGELSNGPAKIANGVRAQFFSIGAWVGDAMNDAKVGAMFDELQQMALQGQLRAQPHELNSLNNYKKAIQEGIGHGVKQILLMVSEEQLGQR